MADNPFNDVADVVETTLPPRKPNICLIANSVLFWVLIDFFYFSSCCEKAKEALLEQIQTRIGVAFVSEISV